MDEEAQQSVLERISTLPSWLLENSDLLVLEYRIVLSSLACIYLASHAALRRPPSAAPPRNAKDKTAERNSGDHEDDSEDSLVTGLLPSDALVFPIMAGIVLVGLYYLIQWLEDPEIINKIMRVYFSFMSLASISTLVSDTLQIATGFVFPSVWISKDRRLYHINGAMKGQFFRPSGSGNLVPDNEKTTPFPSWWSGVSFSPAWNRAMWEARRFLVNDWEICAQGYNLKFKINYVVGFILSIAINGVYLWTKSPALSNLMGYAFSYSGMMFLSPTTFTTGTMFLFGLFFYDIYMVFYTPYMVGVATKLDVPIKLVFEGPKRASMLGLGDIVVPGIFIALCLRFDLFLFYHRRQKLEPVELKTEVQTKDGMVTYNETHRQVIKPVYDNPQGQWGNRFWSTPLSQIFSPQATSAVRASAFPKVYFHAAMAGYFIAMMMTLVVLLIFNRGQPALLYLVPGVVLPVWVTGVIRGELHELWLYTEDGSLDKADQVVEVDGNGNVIRQIEEDDTKTKSTEGEEALNKDGKADENLGTKAKEQANAAVGKNAGHKVFELSIWSPSS